MAFVSRKKAKSRSKTAFGVGLVFYLLDYVKFYSFCDCTKYKAAKYRIHVTYS